jgi:pyrroline-5-carboxylate reductase
LTLKDIGPVVLVGAGKMGLALARGWIAGGLPADKLVLCDPNPSDLARQFAEAHGVRLLGSPMGVLTHVLVLAVKPQVIYDVMADIQPIVGAYTLVISIAAGISLDGIAAALGTKRVIRTMPNTPAQVGRGISGAVGLSITDEDRQVANALLSAAGQVLWFENEASIDGVTAVSGSGPAYVFFMVEALAAAAERQGFGPEQAMQLARATITGAAALLDAEPETTASQLRINVTSPKGTTAAALEVLMATDGLVPLMDKAVEAARRRSEELGRA